MTPATLAPPVRETGGRAAVHPAAPAAGAGLEAELTDDELETVVGGLARVFDPTLARP